MRNNAQGDLPINATERHVVDVVAEWRNVCTFRGVDLNDKDVFPIYAQMRCQFKGEGSKTSFVFSQRYTIDPDCRGRHCALKVDKHAHTPRSRWILKATTVGGDELILFVIKVMPRQLHIRVRNYDFFERRIVEVGQVRSFDP